MSAALSLAIFNARIWTGPRGVSAFDAIGIRGDRISQVGRTADIQRLCTPDTVVIDAKGAFVSPGFTDCHCHFLDGGLRLLSVQLRDVTTKEQFRTRFADMAAKVPPGTWIMGGDWDHHLW